MQRKGIFLIIGSVSVLLAVTGIWSLSKKGNAEEVYGSKGITVMAHKAVYSDVEDSLDLIGVVEALDQVTLYQESADTIDTLHKRVGDSVEIGEVLGTYEEEGKKELTRQIANINLQIENKYLEISNLIQPDHRQELEGYQTQLKAAAYNKQAISEKVGQINEQLELAQMVLDEAVKKEALVQALLDSGAASKEELDAAQINVKENEQKVAALKGQVKSAQNDLALSTAKQQEISSNISILTNQGSSEAVQRQVQIKKNEIEVLENQKENLQEQLNKLKPKLISKFKGSVAEIFVEDGARVETNAPIVSIISNEHQIIKLELTPEDASYVAVGQTCAFTYEGKTTITGTGRVKRIAPSIIKEQKSNGSIERKLPVEIEIDSKSGELIDGEEVEVNLCTAQLEHVICIPKTCIIEENQNAYVYSIEDNKAVKKQVNIKQEIQDDVVIDGIEEGTTIIINHVKELEDLEDVRYKYKDI